jgi:hypothetical protein
VDIFDELAASSSAHAPDSDRRSVRVSPEWHAPFPTLRGC